MNAVRKHFINPLKHMMLVFILQVTTNIFKRHQPYLFVAEHVSGAFTESNLSGTFHVMSMF